MSKSSVPEGQESPPSTAYRKAVDALAQQCHFVGGTLQQLEQQIERQRETLPNGEDVEPELQRAFKHGITYNNHIVSKSGRSGLKVKPNTTTTKARTVKAHPLKPTEDGKAVIACSIGNYKDDFNIVIKPTEPNTRTNEIEFSMIDGNYVVGENTANAQGVETKRPPMAEPQWTIANIRERLTALVNVLLGRKATQEPQTITVSCDQLAVKIRTVTEALTKACKALDAHMQQSSSSEK